MSLYSLPGIDRGPVEYSHSPPIRKQIHFACGEGRLDVVKSLIEEEGVDISMKDSSGNTPMFYAVLRGRLDIVKYLLHAGVLVNSRPNTTYHSLLHFAAACGQKDMCEFLIAKGASVNACNFSGLTPLFFAAFRGSDVTAWVLINAGAHVNVPKSCNATPPFLIAAKEGHLGMLRLLFYHGAEPEVTDADGMTALHHAVVSEYVEIVRLLVIDFNVCLNRENHKNQTPLMLAVRVKNAGIISLLMAAGYDVSREKWIYGKEGNVKMTNNPRCEIIESIRKMASRPRSLQECCCFKIREVLRVTGSSRHPWTSIESLSLPSKLKEYVTLSNLCLFPMDE